MRGFSVWDAADAYIVRVYGAEVVGLCVVICSGFINMCVGIHSGGDSRRTHTRPSYQSGFYRVFCGMNEGNTELDRGTTRRACLVLCVRESVSASRYRLRCVYVYTTCCVGTLHTLNTLDFYDAHFSAAARRLIAVYCRLGAAERLVRCSRCVLIFE